MYYELGVYSQFPIRLKITQTHSTDKNGDILNDIYIYEKLKAAQGKSNMLTGLFTCYHLFPFCIVFENFTY